MGCEELVSMLEEWRKCYLLLMMVKEGIERTLGSWLVEGSCKGKTKVGVGRGVAVVAQGSGMQRLVDGKQ